jgi:hypothetical protein
MKGYAHSNGASNMEEIMPNDNISPVELNDTELDMVSGGIGDNWDTFKENNGGQKPKGEANGVPTVVENPGGQRPPGQQP